ncbi:hypothetical protein BC830DRAFT_1102053 [Chytriomyces sp. MP71]|nr:hypothetical protein BC830DRAFT_1102053 [Chytriomyces sp. MP71]
MADEYRHLGPFYVASPSTAASSERKNALLFGWVDSKVQYVRKYADWYRSRGYTVHIVLCDRSILGVNGPAAQEPFEVLVQDLTAHGLITPLDQESKNKAVIHSFSNGGPVQLRNLLLHLHSQGKKLRTRAVILDSGPGYATASSGSGFMTAGIKNSYARYAARSVLYGAFAMYTSVFSLESHYVNLAAPIVVSQKNVEGNLMGPRLFLYSDVDEIVPVVEVKRRIEECKAEGIPVDEMMFQGSPHVKHAMTFSEEYWGKVEKFLA